MKRTREQESGARSSITGGGCSPPPGSTKDLAASSFEDVESLKAMNRRQAGEICFLVKELDELHLKLLKAESRIAELQGDRLQLLACPPSLPPCSKGEPLADCSAEPASSAAMSMPPTPLALTAVLPRQLCLGPATGGSPGGARSRGGGEQGQGAPTDGGSSQQGPQPLLHMVVPKVETAATARPAVRESYKKEATSGGCVGLGPGGGGTEAAAARASGSLPQQAPAAASEHSPIPPRELTADRGGIPPQKRRKQDRLASLLPQPSATSYLKEAAKCSPLSSRRGDFSKPCLAVSQVSSQPADGPPRGSSGRAPSRGQQSMPMSPARGKVLIKPSFAQGSQIDRAAAAVGNKEAAALAATGPISNRQAACALAAGGAPKSGRLHSLLQGPGDSGDCQVARAAHERESEQLPPQKRPCLLSRLQEQCRVLAQRKAERTLCPARGPLPGSAPCVGDKGDGLPPPLPLPQGVPSTVPDECTVTSGAIIPPKVRGLEAKQGSLLGAGGVPKVQTAVKPAFAQSVESQCAAAMWPFMGYWQQSDAVSSVGPSSRGMKPAACHIAPWEKGDGLAANGLSSGEGSRAVQVSDLRAFPDFRQYRQFPHGSAQEPRPAAEFGGGGELGPLSGYGAGGGFSPPLLPIGKSTSVAWPLGTLRAGGSGNRFCPAPRCPPPQQPPPPSPRRAMEEEPAAAPVRNFLEASPQKGRGGLPPGTPSLPAAGGVVEGAAALKKYAVASCDEEEARACQLSLGWTCGGAPGELGGNRTHAPLPPRVPCPEAGSPCQGAGPLGLVKLEGLLSAQFSKEAAPHVPLRPAVEGVRPFLGRVAARSGGGMSSGSLFDSQGPGDGGQHSGRGLDASPGGRGGGAASAAELALAQQGRTGVEEADDAGEGDVIPSATHGGTEGGATCPPTGVSPPGIGRKGPTLHEDQRAAGRPPVAAVQGACPFPELILEAMPPFRIIPPRVLRERALQPAPAACAAGPEAVAPPPGATLSPREFKPKAAECREVLELHCSRAPSCRSDAGTGASPRGGEDATGGAASAREAGCAGGDDSRPEEEGWGLESGAPGAREAMRRESFTSPGKGVAGATGRLGGDGEGGGRGEGLLLSAEQWGRFDALVSGGCEKRKGRPHVVQGALHYGAFLEDCCEWAPGVCLSASVLLAAYHRWASACAPPCPAAFVKNLQQQAVILGPLGLDLKKKHFHCGSRLRSVGMNYRGIALRPAAALALAAVAGEDVDGDPAAAAFLGAGDPAQGSFQEDSEPCPEEEHGGGAGSDTGADDNDTDTATASAANTEAPPQGPRAAAPPPPLGRMSSCVRRMLRAVGCTALSELDGPEPGGKSPVPGDGGSGGGSCLAGGSAARFAPVPLRPLLRVPSSGSEVLPQSRAEVTAPPHICYREGRFREVFLQRAEASSLPESESSEQLPGPEAAAPLPPSLDNGAQGPLPPLFCPMRALLRLAGQGAGTWKQAAEETSAPGGDAHVGPEGLADASSSPPGGPLPGSRGGGSSCPPPVRPIAVRPPALRSPGWSLFHRSVAPLGGTSLDPGHSCERLVKAELGAWGDTWRMLPASRGEEGLHSTGSGSVAELQGDKHV